MLPTASALYLVAVRSIPPLAAADADASGLLGAVLSLAAGALEGDGLAACPHAPARIAPMANSVNKRFRM